MKNIFEGAQFSDRFLTKGKGIAVYISCTHHYEDFGKSIYEHNLLIQEAGGDKRRKYRDDLNGCYLSGNRSAYDIVSRYPEDIDEEKLKELAEKTEQYESNDGRILYKSENAKYTAKDLDIVFIAGYHKAKEK